ncbi:MAG: T9SS type A sorting domain-containing protein, partial [Ignavibacteriae bacterium]|nr:T9SS type A sorting domain-containing protein [Ignavibacteriota bacterium]
VFTRSGTAVGGPVGVGPGSSTAGWTSLGIFPAVQGSTASGVSLVFMLPPISVLAGDTVGVAIKFTGAGPRYVGTGSPPYSVYSDSNLTLITGDGRSAPFTTTGSWFASRAMVGVIRYVVSTPTGVINVSSEIPDGFKLSQNYPNPFNPTTNIKYQIPKNSFVSLKVYNSIGKEVAVLVNKSLSPGTYETTFDASKYPSGVYFYKLTTDGFSETKRMVLIK